MDIIDISLILAFIVFYITTFNKSLTKSNTSEIKTMYSSFRTLFKITAIPAYGWDCPWRLLIVTYFYWWILNIDSTIEINLRELVDERLDKILKGALDVLKQALFVLFIFVLPLIL